MESLTANRSSQLASHASNTRSANRKEDEYPDLEMALTIVKQWIPVAVTIAGIFGNTISFLITTKREYRHVTTCAYMSALSVFDTSNLSWYMFYIPGVDSGFNVSQWQTILRLTIYMVYCSAISSRLTLAAMTADRACAVLYPLKVKTFCTVSKARKIIAFMATFPIVANMYMFWTYEVKIMRGGTFAIFVNVEGYHWVEILIAVYTGSVTSIIPFTVILVSNVLILKGVRAASSSRNKLGKVDGAGSGADDAHLTRILLLVSLAFLICCLPYTLYELLFSIPAFSQMYRGNSRYFSLREGLILWSTACVTQMNHAINFYLYVLGGGKKFTNDVHNVLLCRRGK